MNTCPMCGAEINEERDCEAIFGEFLALEFSDPGYGAVHFLTVASYMIQHDRYSDEALLWIKGMLRRYFEEHLSDQQLRAFAQQSVQEKDWKVKRAPDAKPLPRIAWGMTIADVDRDRRDAASYRELIKRWAQVTLEQMSAAG